MDCTCHECRPNLKCGITHSVENVANRPVGCVRLTLVVYNRQRGHGDACVQHLNAVGKGDEEAKGEECPTEDDSMLDADPSCGKGAVRFVAPVFFWGETLVRDVELQDM